jgi:CubicO group peptidase (beta-lactamase class C family)
MASLWPGSKAMAQQILATLDKNEPELRAILSEIEADAEKARVKARIPAALGSFACLFLLQGASLSTKDRGEQEKKESPVVADLLTKLQSSVEKHQIPGLAAAVVKEGRLVAHGIYGVRVSGKPERLQLGDRFHFASCTKSMTAMLAARLVEEKRIKWDSRVRDVLPDLARAARPEYWDVTLIQLLAHTGHMPSYTSFPEARARELRALVGSHEAQRLAFLKQVLATEPPNPGTGNNAYSNAGYALVGAMLERAADRSWERLIKERLFLPLHFKGAVFGWPATPQHPDQPRGHWREEGGQVQQQPLDHPFLVPCLWPAGAVSGTIDDFALYAKDHLDGLLGRKALLKPETYRRLHTTLNGDKEGFTLGWGVRSDPELGTVHFGAGSGGTYWAQIALFPEHDVAVVVLSNSGGAGPAAGETIRDLALAYRR